MGTHENELRLHRVRLHSEPLRVGGFLMRDDPEWCSLSNHVLAVLGSRFETIYASEPIGETIRNQTWLCAEFESWVWNFKSERLGLGFGMWFEFQVFNSARKRTGLVIPSAGSAHVAAGARNPPILQCGGGSFGGRKCCLGKLYGGRGRGTKGGLRYPFPFSGSVAL